MIIVWIFWMQEPDIRLSKASIDPFTHTLIKGPNLTFNFKWSFVALLTNILIFITDSRLNMNLCPIQNSLDLAEFKFKKNFPSALFHGRMPLFTPSIPKQENLFRLFQIIFQKHIDKFRIICYTIIP